MPVREIRRESFSHQGRAYAVVVIDDGRRLTAVAERDGKTARGGRFPAAPYGWGGYSAAEVDNLIDAVKRWLIDGARPSGGGPFF